MDGHEGPTQPGGDADADVLDCDLCILGSGIAGLNALFAASRHSTGHGTIVLVDRDPSPAGMWNRVYDYVRLHQPHPMFTAGNIPWRWQKDPNYLAAKTEVLDHLGHCFEVLRARTGLDARLGYEYLGHDESGHHPVTVHCRRNADAAPLTIRARRLIKAFGYNVRPNPPLALSSQAVRSVSPDSYDLFGPEMQGSEAPVYVVGGGKTGMDTVHTLVTRMPGKRVRFLIGAGTMFVDRDKTNPRGFKRYWGGSTTLDVFVDAASRFDGHNEVEAMAQFRARYAVCLDDQCRRFAFGVLSREENRVIARGVDEVIRDHLVDVVDTPDGPVMVLRSGERRPLEPGAIIVNTSGYIVREPAPYEPYLSAGGHVLSIQPTSTVHFLSSQSAYFLSHLFLMGKLKDVPLYEADVAELREASRDVFAPAAISLTLYNTTLLMKHLPRWVLEENGLDFLRLFPVHRRLLSFLKLVRFTKRHPTHLRDALDTVRARFGVRLGPLQHSA